MRERTKHNKEMRSPEKRTHLARNVYSNDDHVPIIQNAVKTPTPPHCASFIADAVVGTISTFVEDQCARGMNVFNISLICVLFRRGGRGETVAFSASLARCVICYFYCCFCFSSFGQKALLLVFFRSRTNPLVHVSLLF